MSEMEIVLWIFAGLTSGLFVKWRGRCLKAEAEIKNLQEDKESAWKDAAKSDMNNEAATDRALCAERKLNKLEAEKESLSEGAGRDLKEREELNKKIEEVQGILSSSNWHHVAALAKISELETEIATLKVSVEARDLFATAIRSRSKELEGIARTLAAMANCDRKYVEQELGV